MVPIVLSALARIKADVAVHLRAASIERLCAQLGYTWRDRILTPAVTIHAFLMQVLHGNTACSHVPHLMGGSFTGEAYCQARQRLPLAFFQRLLALVTQSMRSCHDHVERWCGHRVWFLDG
jgi:hypothetical protein